MKTNETHKERPYRLSMINCKELSACGTQTYSPMSSIIQWDETVEWKQKMSIVVLDQGISLETD